MSTELSTNFNQSNFDQSLINPILHVIQPYFIINLPQIKINQDKSFYWTSNIGHHLLQRLDISIGSPFSNKLNLL